MSRAVFAAGVVVALGLFAFGPSASPTRSVKEPGGLIAPVIGPAQSSGIAGDVDCSGGATPVSAGDALKVLRFVARLSVAQNDPCDDIGTGGPPVQGDVDCSDSATPVSAVDALKILRAVVGLPVAQNEPCEDIGAALTTPTPSPPPTLTPTATPTPTPTPTPSPTPGPTPGPDGWLGCEYATDWNGGDDTGSVCVNEGQEHAEPLLAGTSCDADPDHGAVAFWSLPEVPPTGLPLKLRLDMYADPGAFACVKVSNHIVTYEIPLSTTETSYYLDLPPVTEAGVYLVWVEFRSSIATNRYAWLDFAGLQSPTPTPTPTPPPEPTPGPT